MTGSARSAAGAAPAAWRRPRYCRSWAPTASSRWAAGACRGARTARTAVALARASSRVLGEASLEGATEAGPCPLPAVGLANECLDLARPLLTLLAAQRCCLLSMRQTRCFHMAASMTPTSATLCTLCTAPRLQALQVAQPSLLDQLSRPGWAGTVLVPTDAAWDAALAQYGAVLQSPALLQQVLKFHLLPPEPRTRQALAALQAGTAAQAPNAGVGPGSPP